jgi:taurine transport system permease protein
MTSEMKTRLARLGRWTGQYAGAVAIVGFWEFYVRAGLIDPYLLPAPSAILERAVQQAMAGDLVLFTGLTMYRGIVGFLIAAALGVVIGTLAARNAFCRWFFDPLVSIGFPAPKIAFMPIFVLWFGFDDTSKLMMIAATCIFPIISATYLGATSIDRYFIWSARNLGMSERRVLWKIVIPAALPQILSGFQIAFPMALVLAVVTEMITGGAGLGGYMMRSARFAQSEQMFVGLVTIAVIGFLMLSLFDRLRRYLLRWHAESQMAL